MRILRRRLSSIKKPTTHYNFAHLLSNQFGDHAAASLHYQEAIKLNPSFKEAYAGLAMLYAYVDPNYEFAEKLLSKCIDFDSKDAKSHLNLFMIHTQIKKDYKIAKRHYDRALEIDPAIKNFQVENPCPTSEKDKMISSFIILSKIHIT